MALPDELPLELELLLSLADDVESPASGLLATVVSSLPEPTFHGEEAEPSLDDALELTDTEEEPLELVELSVLMELEPLVLVKPLVLTLALELRLLLLVSDEHAATSGSISCDRSSRPVPGMEQSWGNDASSSWSSVTQAVVLHTLAACAAEGALVCVAIDTPEVDVQAATLGLVAIVASRVVEHTAACTLEAAANAESASANTGRKSILAGVDWERGSRYERAYS